VSLPPGIYTVSASQPQIGSLAPSVVRVVAGQPRKVSFVIDTGMR
jgi:hypothetical protein